MTSRRPEAEQAPAVEGRPVRRVFYGWVVVATVFAVLCVSAGLGFYGLTVYLSALVDARGFSVTAVSGATAVFFAASGVAGVAVASQLERRDPRVVVTAGAVLGAVALLLLGRVTAEWQVYVAYAVFGAGFAASSLVPATTLVARWFTRRRSVALSVASTGLSAGGVLLTPWVAGAVEAHGLPAVAPWLALAFLVGIVPVTVLLLRASPGDMGLHPDGAALGAEGVTPLTGTRAADALRTRYYRVLTGAHSLAMLAQVGGIAHLYHLVGERLDDASTAATAVSLLAVSSLGGRLLGGWLTTRCSMRLLYGLLAVVQAVALVVLAVGDGTAVLLLSSVLFGLTVGNLLMLHPLLLAERFGVLHYGRIYARSHLTSTIGVAAGPFVLGALHDAAGGYAAAFVAAAGASLAAAALVVRTGPTHTGRPDAPDPAEEQQEAGPAVSAPL